MIEKLNQWYQKNAEEIRSEPDCTHSHNLQGISGQCYSIQGGRKDGEQRNAKGATPCNSYSRFVFVCEALVPAHLPNIQADCLCRSQVHDCHG